MGRPSPNSSSKLWATAGATDSDRFARSHAASSPPAKAPLVAILSASAFRAIRTLYSFGGGARLIFGAAFRGPIGLLNSVFSEPGQRDSNREQHRGQDEEELRRRGQARKAFGRRHRAALELLAELPDKVEEVVRNGLAQSVVVNRPQRSTQITLPSCAFGRFRLLRVPGLTGSLRLASFIRTQLLIPLTRVVAAFIQIALMVAMASLFLPRFET